MTASAEHGVRLATRDDLPAIRSVVDAAYRPYIERIGKKPGPMLADYEALVDRGHVQVAERDGGIEGVLVLIPDDGYLLLDNVAVAPGAQGTGLGRYLLACAEAAATAAGYDRIRLYTHAAMTESFGLYEHIGYSITHRARERGYDRIYMEKRIRPE